MIVVVQIISPASLVGLKNQEQEEEVEEDGKNKGRISPAASELRKQQTLTHHYQRQSVFKVIRGTGEIK